MPARKVLPVAAPDPIVGYIVRMSSTRLTQITVAVAVIIIAAIIVAPRLGGVTTAQATSLDVSDQPVLGSADAPVQLVMFEDFLCPSCGTFTNTVLPRVKREYVDTGQVAAYFLNFPVMQGSETAAVAAECVFLQDKDAFWDVYEAFFRVQNELNSKRRVLELAVTYAPGIDAAQLEQCVDGNETIELVRADARMAQAAGATGTPTVFVDGIRLANWDFESISQAITQALP